jgi:hypothetical protein
LRIRDDPSDGYLIADFLSDILPWAALNTEITMNQPTAFADVLDAAEQLDADAQAELVAILSRRLAERGRERVVDTVAQARREFKAGQCQPTTPAEIVREAQP